MDVARIIERAEARNAVGCAVSRARLLNIRPAWLRVDSGIAVFSGPDSPLTHAVGVGFARAPIPAALDTLEAFFRTGHSRARLRLAPFIRPDFRREAQRRGYIREGVLQVLLRRPAAFSAGEKPRRSVRIDKRNRRFVLAWNTAVAEGFLGRNVTHPADLQVAMIISGARGAQCFAGIREHEFAGGAALAVHGRVAIFFGDATRPDFRGKGVHHSLIRARLGAAREAACEWCVAAAVPGSASERNYKAAGFSAAYPVVQLVLPSDRRPFRLDHTPFKIGALG
jgi:GNAT superfamily N-acetyltransferase